ncbi:hypothetical protein ACFL5O_04645 [Myxococcota bacterium]
MDAFLAKAELGFSLHAATTASADDAREREALVRYALRPAIAQQRLHLLPNDRVRIQLRRPFRDGTLLMRSGRMGNRLPPPATGRRLLI